MSEHTKSERVHWEFEYRSQLSRERIEERFEELVRRRWMRAGPGDTLADVFVSESGVVVQIDLPGVDAEQVSAQLSGGDLVIEARRAFPLPAEGLRALRLERARGTVHRRIPIPELSGRFDLALSTQNGVLTVEIRPEERG